MKELVVKEEGKVVKYVEMVEKGETGSEDSLSREVGPCRSRAGAVAACPPSAKVIVKMCIVLRMVAMVIIMIMVTMVIMMIMVIKMVTIL